MLKNVKRVEHTGEHDLSLQWRQLEAFRADHPLRHVWAAGWNWENIISGRWDPPLLIQSGAMRGASRSHTVGILRAGSAHYLAGRLSSMADERPGPTRSFARTELAYVMKTWRSPVVNVDSPG